MASKEENTLSIISNSLGSATAGIVGRIVTHPLDTAKARLQSLSGPSYRGVSDVLFRTFRSEGWGGLYRGFGTVIIGGTPGTIIYLCGYDIFKEKLSFFVPNDNKQGFVVHFMSGIMAEAVACLVYVPVDVIKERLQIQHMKDSSRYKGGYDALLKIIKTEGPLGIYRGYGATLASFGPFSALYFVFYEQFKSLSRIFLHKRQIQYGETLLVDEMKVMTAALPLSFTILSSSSAGALASFLTSPLDMVKLRLQVQRGSQRSPLSSMLSNSLPSDKSTSTLFQGMTDALICAYESGGIPGLFRGAGARVLHVVPLTTIIMTLYETCRNFFHEKLNESSCN